MSLNFPCNGGIIAPPKIIIIKNAEPCAWYFPKPPNESEKIQGHMMEQNNPTLHKAYTETIPTVVNPITVAINPNKLNIIKVRAGLFLPK